MRRGVAPGWIASAMRCGSIMQRAALRRDVFVRVASSRGGNPRDGCCRPDPPSGKAVARDIMKTLKSGHDDLRKLFSDMEDTTDPAAATEFAKAMKQPSPVPVR